MSTVAGQRVERSTYRLSERVRRWASASTSRKIFSAAVSVGVITLAVRVASTVKELILAAKFGTGDALDAFLIALVMPSFLLTVVARSAATAFIPTYVRVREERGSEDARRLSGSVMTLTLAMFSIISALMIWSAERWMPLLAKGFDAEKIELTVRLFNLLTIVAVVKAVSTLWSSMLNASERFSIAAAIPGAVPAATVLALLLGPRSWGIFAAAYGIIAGYGIELIVLGVVVKRRGLGLMPGWGHRRDDLRRVVGQYLPMLAAGFLLAGMSIVDDAMAAMLPAGSVATLGYGQKLVSLIQNVGSLALGTALLPYLSKMVALGEWRGIRSVIRTYGLLIAAVTIPLTVLICFGSEPIIRVLFERGKFSGADTVNVAWVQTLYALQTPFVLANILIVRFISAVQGNRILLATAAVQMPLNIVGNYVLMQRFGVAGIALSTTVVCAVTLVITSSCAYYFYLRDDVRSRVTSELSTKPRTGRDLGDEVRDERESR